ncbi:aldehyde dehydrogenase family protein [Microbulbifer sp. TYP-18]|uniref:aldehyde dehydrogenase family protein n=1 Tax=Microbulbifer sp. TYP-18 TaxID=3230024 RepID=UPI0034C5C051
MQSRRNAGCLSSGSNVLGGLDAKPHRFRCIGERIHEQVPDGGYYVRPAIVRIAHDAEIVQAETFAPALYVMTYRDLAGC